MTNNNQMWQKFEFYILSLFLLFFIIFIIKVPCDFSQESRFVGIKSLLTTHLIIIICVSGMFCGVVSFIRFRANFETGTTLLPMKVMEVSDINFESVTFLATYIVPLACIDLDKDRSCLMLVTILILIGWIYIKTNLFYTNPTLAIWGYHIFKVTVENSHERKENVIILVRGKVQKADTIRLKEIDDEIFLGK